MILRLREEVFSKNKSDMSKGHGCLNSAAFLRLDDLFSAFVIISVGGFYDPCMISHCSV